MSITKNPFSSRRLKNEITRLTTVKALTRVAQSPLGISLDPILNTDFLPVLAGEMGGREGGREHKGGRNSPGEGWLCGEKDIQNR